ncbi:MAG: SNF2-related protein [Bacteroidales bacterium]
MNTDIVIALTHDKQFGLIAEPLVVDKKSTGFNIRIIEKLNEHSIPENHMDLPDELSDIFRLYQLYDQRNVYDVFRTSRYKNRKDFYDKLSEEKINKSIRPYIEDKLTKIIRIVNNAGIEIYLKTTHGYLDKNDKIQYYHEPAEPVLNIIKEHNQTKYRLLIKQGDKEISLLNKPYTLVTEKPCNIIIEGRLYAFEHLDFKKLLPFFTKEQIHVSASMEKSWYKHFALPNIKKYRVKASGFKIDEHEPEKQAVLALGENLKNEPVLILKFKYGKHVFFANRGEQIIVDMEKKDDTIRFHKFERDVVFENQHINRLKKLGLKQLDLNYFFPVDYHAIEKQDDKLYALIEWLKASKSKLQDAGITVEQGDLSKIYCISIPEIQFFHKQNKDWFDIYAKVVIGEHVIPFIEFREHILNKIRSYKLPDGTIFILPLVWFEQYSEIFVYGKKEKECLKLKKHHYKLLEDRIGKSDQFDLQIMPDDDKVSKDSLPDHLQSVMRDYQKHGVIWMKQLNVMGFGGCLADDMGLGKTLQCLCLLLSEKQQYVAGCGTQEKVSDEQPEQLSLFSQNQEKHALYSSGNKVFLVIVPTSLIYNWKNEIHKFTPQMKVSVYTGQNRSINTNIINNHDIILTTYGIVRNDVHLLKQYTFDYIILDESQFIKNRASKTCRAVTELNSRNKLVMTGTPVENSLSDLWAQMNFLNPGLLGSFDYFRRAYIDPIEKHKNEEREAKLRSFIEPFLLRRTKFQVAKELPQKTEQVYYCEMTPAQQDYYDREKSRIRHDILEKMVEADGAFSVHVLQALSKLRQIANHPVMIDAEYDGDSGKYNEVTATLDNVIAGGHKALVFSSYKKHLKLIENYLQAKDLCYAMLTGETSNREKEVDAFQNNSDVPVFLIQIKAGGFGLNLTAADYVMILDPWWNPAVENQAVNRAHRIGQKNNIMVYRFVTMHTVENKIKKLQEEKAELAGNMIKPTSVIKNLEKEELLGLLQ